MYYGKFCIGHSMNLDHEKEPSEPFHKKYFSYEELGSQMTV